MEGQTPYYCEECGTKLIKFRSNYIKDWAERRLHKKCYKEKIKPITEIIIFLEKNDADEDVIQRYKNKILPNYHTITGDKLSID